jgi:peroxiredoxin
MAVATGGLLGWQYTGVRAMAEIQVSTPTLTLPNDQSTTRITAHFQFMAHITPDPDSTPIAEFLHGEVQATVDASQVAWQNGSQFNVDFSVLDFDFRTGNLQITFMPAPGTENQYSQHDIALIEQVMGNLLGAGFGSASAVVNLPAAVHSMQFKTLPDGALPAVALLLNLTAHAVSQDAADGVTTTFVGAQDDFAIAVGQEYVVSTLTNAISGTIAQFISAITAGQSTSAFQISFNVLLSTVTYTITFTGLSVTLQSGTISVTLQAHAHRETWWAVLLPGDIDFSLTQAFTLYMQNNVVNVAYSGDPVINPNIPGKDSIVTVIDKYRDQLLGPASAQIQQVLSGIDFGTILQGLKVPNAQASYTAIAVQGDGIILHGILSLGPWQTPVPANDGLMIQRNQQNVLLLDAYASWIPGGTVQSYTWSTTSESATENHQFMTFVTPDSTNAPTQWCVKISGTQTTDTGDTQTVERWSCTIHSPIMSMLSSDGQLAANDRLVISVPGIGPDPVPDAYYDPWSAGITSPGSSANTVVYFATESSLQTLGVFGEALVRSGVQEASLYVIVVLPRGSMAHTSLMASSPVHMAAHAATHAAANVNISLTEDFEGCWARAFDVRERPMTLLVGPMGMRTWQHVGALDTEHLATIFREHVVAAGPICYQPLALTIRVGDRAPDFSFEFAHERRMPLRRLRGRPVLLVFWTSWAEPSVRELRDLMRRYGERSADVPVILAINDGEDPAHAMEVFERQGISFGFVPDPTRKVARLYGVHCWPTTIVLDAAGRITTIQMGRSHGSDFFRQDSLSLLAQR